MRVTRPGLWYCHHLKVFLSEPRLRLRNRRVRVAAISCDPWVSCWFQGGNSPVCWLLFIRPAIVMTACYQEPGEKKNKTKQKTHGSFVRRTLRRSLCLTATLPPALCATWWCQVWRAEWSVKCICDGFDARRMKRTWMNPNIHRQVNFNFFFNRLNVSLVVEKVIPESHRYASSKSLSPNTNKRCKTSQTG